MEEKQLGEVKEQQENNTQEQITEVVDKIIEAKPSIRQERLSNFKDVMYADLLGDFDENGKYTLSDEISADLVSMTKKIDAYTTRGIEAHTLAGDRTFKFVLTIPVTLPNGDAYCYLELLEEIPRINGYYIDTHTTIVATYQYKNSDQFLDMALELFHFKKFKDDQDPQAEFLPQSIAVRLAVLKELRDKYGDLFQKYEEIYFNKRLQILNEDPTLSVIIAEFIAKRKKCEQFLVKGPNRFEHLNRLLNEILLKEAYAEMLKNSQVKDKLLALDKKFYQHQEVLKQKAQEDNQVKKEEENVFVGTIPKPLPKNVSKGKTTAKPNDKGKGDGKKGGGGGGKGGGGKGGGGKGGGGGGAKKPTPQKSTPPYVPPYRKPTSQNQDNKEIGAGKSTENDGLFQ